MKYGDEHLRKFGLGDIVRVRSDLQIGRKYYTLNKKGDTFTSRMSKNLGKEGRVIEITYLGYKLDIDPMHTYTEEMLEEPSDILAKSNYVHNESVESILEQSELMYYQKQIDEALKNRMFETDLESFQKLVEEYKKIYNKYKK